VHAFHLKIARPAVKRNIAAALVWDVCVITRHVASVTQRPESYLAIVSKVVALYTLSCSTLCFFRPCTPSLPLPVQYARKFRDSGLPRPWSKYSEGSSKHDKAAKAETAAPADKAQEKKAKGKKGKETAAEGETADGKLAEFLALMQPRVKASIWSNDDVAMSLKGERAGSEKDGHADE
jgi:hypothetical protein